MSRASCRAPGPLEELTTVNLPRDAIVKYRYSGVRLKYTQTKGLNWNLPAPCAAVPTQSGSMKQGLRLTRIIIGCSRLVRRHFSRSLWLLLGSLLVTVAVPLLAQRAQPDPVPQPDPAPAQPLTDALADPPPDDSVELMLPHFKSTRFWISGQANFIFQTHPEFPALYSGPHSLNPHYEKATSRLMTLYTGVRLNNSTEFLVAIEEAGGAALTQGFGLAGNTDLDIVRNPLLSKAPYLGRGMFHHVFALSTDKIENQRNAFSLFDELPRRRLEFRLGKFGMPDFFDVNSVGSDTHFQFINWTTDNNGAWDYAADTRGYTVGAVLDFEDRNWDSALPRASCRRS